jgi:hypothetical protein
MKENNQSASNIVGNMHVNFANIAIGEPTVLWKLRHRFYFLDIIST